MCPPEKVRLNPSPSTSAKTQRSTLIPVSWQIVWRSSPIVALQSMLNPSLTFSQPRRKEYQLNLTNEQGDPFFHGRPHL
jgi:hypothetical protein